MLVAENGARLERRGNDAIQRHELHTLTAFDGGRGRSDARIDERAEAFAECNFCHRNRECREPLAERQMPFAISGDRFLADLR